MKEQFLKEYKALCLKYSMELRGCGECGSAWLSELDDEQKKISRLCWERDFEVVQFADTWNLEDKDKILDGF